MKTLALVLALAAPQDRVREEIQSKLTNLRITLDFTDAPLDAVVDYVREIADLNLFVDRKVREMDLAVSMRVKEIAVGSVLRLMLSPHGVGTMVRDGVLMIMTDEDIRDRTVRLQLYDCRDILLPVQEFPGVDIDLAADLPGVAFITAPDPSDDVFPVEEMVRAHTGGTSWDDHPKASVSLQNGILMVRNTPEVHGQVRRLLDMLRRSR